MNKRLFAHLLITVCMTTAALKAEPNSHSDEDLKKDSSHSSSNRAVEPMRDAVSVCLVSDFDKVGAPGSGGVHGRIGGACKLNGAEQGVALELDEGLKDILSEPVIISDGQLCKKDGLKSSIGASNPTKEYKNVLEKKLVQHCIKLICKEKGLGDNCNIAPGAVNMSPDLMDKVVKMYGAQKSCKKSDILQINR
jgi:hypothetical protein